MNAKEPLIDWGNILTMLLICGGVFVVVLIVGQISDQANDRYLHRANHLTECQACGKDVSRKATSCPHCGEPRVAY